MSCNFGRNIKISIFGQSHSAAIGVLIEGLPAGEKISMAEVDKFMQRRAPGKNRFATSRSEADKAEVLSGIVDGVTCGTPICATIANTDVRSGDYAEIADIPRPAHADYPAHFKYGGKNDVRGGGHFSGRMTAPLCFAGAVAMQLLARRGITVGAHILSIGSAKDKHYDPVSITAAELNAVKEKNFAVYDDNSAEEMKKIIDNAILRADSVGGVIELAAVGLPIGLGTHMFGGIENRMSQAIFGIPAVRGIEFGAGFASAEMYGSENNDEYYMDGDTVKTRTNNHGGVLGGMTTGMPLIMRTAIKPTPSIGIEQRSVSLSKKQDVPLIIKGRHDPCIVPRAVPCIEAAAGLVLLDLLAD